MSAPRPSTLHNIRKVIRAATNLPPRACLSTFNVLASYGDHETGRNVFVGVPQISKETKSGDRQPREHLQRLRDGHWIDYQEAPDEGRAAEYYKKKFKDPRHRPPIYRLVVETLTATSIEHVPGGPFKGCGICNPKPKIKSCGNSHLRAAEIDTQGLRPAATNHPMTSDTTYPRSTDSHKDESLLQESNPPTTRGGSGSSGSASDLLRAGETEEDIRFDPTETEIVLAADAALEILDQGHASMTPYSGKAEAALTKVTEGGDTCLMCALLVPYWVADDEDALKGMNQRLNLPYLWGPNFKYHLDLALKSYAAKSGAKYFETAERTIYSERLRDNEDALDAIEGYCTTCTQRQIKADGDERAEWRRMDRRAAKGLPN